MVPSNRALRVLAILSLAVVFSRPADAQFTQQGSKLIGIVITGSIGATLGDGVALSSDGTTLVAGGSSDNNNQGAVWVYTRSGGVWTQQGSKLVGSGATNTTPAHGYAVAVSADGNTLIEGAPFDGADGMTGAAYIFTRSGGLWTQQARLVDSTSAGNGQGFSVALSADGNTALVGGPGDSGSLGAAWVYTRSGGAWTQQFKLVGTGAQGASTQGIAVALSGNGNTALVGGSGDNSGTGAAWVFTRSGSTWSQQAELNGTGTQPPPANLGIAQGAAVALSADGSTAIVGGYGDNGAVGAAWIYTRSGSSWAQQGAKLVGNAAVNAASQGFSVALSGDGNEALIGGPGDNFAGSGVDAIGAAWVFRRSGAVWTQLGIKLFGSGGLTGTVPNSNPAEADGPQQGWSVALSADGSTAALGGNGDNSNIGAVWVFAQPHFNLSTPTSATSGTAFNFTLSAQDANNSPLGSYSGTVHFTTSDGNASLPADTLVSGGSGSFPATLRTAGSQTITATDATNSGIDGTSNSISVSGGTVSNATHFSVSAPSSATAGVPVSFTVTAQDASNHTVTGYSGTVQFSSSDKAATLPANAKLTAGTGTFQATLYTTPAATITATDTVNSSITGTSASIAVAGSGSALFTQQGAKLVGTGYVGSSQEGFGLALSGDGNTAIVGGPFDNGNVGAAWVFVRSGGAWSQQSPKLVGTGATGGSLQGGAVALSSDGNTALVGGLNDNSGYGAVWVYKRSNGVWSQSQKLLPTGGTGATLNFGGSVAISADGSTAAIGAGGDNAGGGAVYIFTNSGGTFTQQGRLAGNGATGSSMQGSGVALSSDGSTLVEGGFADNGGTGAVWVFTRSGGVWTQQGSKLVATGATTTSNQGAFVSLSADGNTAAVSGGTGACVFTRSGAAWTQQGPGLFAVSGGVALSGDGNTLIGSAPLGFIAFTRSGGLWIQQGGAMIGTGGSGATSGFYVALSSDGNTALEASTSDNSGVGAVWPFTRGSGGTPTATHFVFSQAPAAATAGSAISFTLTAQDANNNTVTGYSGTVNFTSTDSAFTPPTGHTLPGGSATFTATLNTVGPQTITATDSANSSITGTSNSIVVSSGGGGTNPFVQQGPKQTGSNANSSAGFVHQGNSVAISADGNTAVVGAPGDNGGFLSGVGAVYVFTRSGGLWTQQGSKQIGNGASGNALQGSAVAISADGNTLIEGGNEDSNGTGAIWVFTRSGGTWTQQGSKLVGTNGTGAVQGFAVALSGDGNTALVGGYADNSETGAAWVFARSGGVWTQQGDKLVGTGAVGNATQGGSVALSFDGNTAIVGGFMDNNVTGAAWVFTRSGGVWTQQGNKLVGSGSVGQTFEGVSVSLSGDGNTALIGGDQDNNGAGAVWVFTRSGTVWTQQGGKLVGTGNTGAAQQGVSVSLSSDGNTAVWGGNFDNSNAGTGTGAVWVYTRSGGTWTQLGSKLVGTGATGAAAQGGSVAISGDGNTIVEGGISDNNEFGAAWFFARPASAGGTATHFSVSAPGTATVGTPFSFTVTAQDSGNNTATGYTGTVHFTSTDGSPALPANATLTAGVGVGTFQATLNTVGSQSITATDTASSSITGTSAAIVVSPGSVGGLFTQQSARLVGTGAQPGGSGSALENFGRGLAVSGDGNTLAVGANEDGGIAGSPVGAVWVFTRSAGVWSQQGAKLVGAGASGNAAQGQAVALSGDGNTLIEGGTFDGGLVGAAWVFTRTNGVWSQQGSKLVGTGTVGSAAQGNSVALSSDGNTAIVGGYQDNTNVGAAFVFTRSGGVWTQQAKLVGSGASGSEQGWSVALSGDGNTAMVGGVSDSGSSGAAWVFTRTGTMWTQQGGKLVGTGATAGAQQGSSVALSTDGSTALIGGYGDNNAMGAVWVFTRTSGVWTQQGNKLVGPGTSGVVLQGASVSLSGDGNTAAWGAPGQTGAGGVFVFTRSNGVWTQLGVELTAACAASNATQGVQVRVSADGNTLVETSVFDGSLAGSAWVFVRGGSAVASGTHFTVSAPATASALVPFNFTVAAVDACNNPVASYTGTVHFTSTDALAGLPADSMLASGTGMFSATLKTPGSQTITATDTSNAAVTGTSSAITVTGGLVPPTPVSLSPPGGNAPSQTYTFVYTDPRGYTDMNVLNVLVNNFIDGRRACYLAYVVPQNLLVLVDDGGDAGGPYAGNVTLGNVNPISNGQCSVVLVSATGSGNSLTLVLTITWTANFAGDKIVFMAGRDGAGNNSGWYPLGVWRAPGGTQTISTAVVGTTPFRGTGIGPGQFTFSLSDNKGFQDIGVSNILINTSLDGRHACYLAFSRPGNVMYLVNDNGDALLPGQSMAAAGSVSNSQCVVSWGATPVNASGNNLTLTLTIGFTNSFGGNLIVYSATRDVNEANSTDWHAGGTWGNGCELTPLFSRLSCAVLNTSHPLAANLAGLFLMNEGSGTTDTNLVDLQTAAFSGASLPAWNATDPSIVFNGGGAGNSYANAGADLTFDQMPTGKMTIAARIFVNTVAAGGICEKDDGNAADGFEFGLDGTGALKFLVERHSINMRIGTAGGAVAAGQWMQVAVTWDGTVDTAAAGHLYINGVEQTKAQAEDGAGTLAYTGATNQPFRIGNSSFDATGGSLNGKMEYLAVYKGRILSAAELSQLDASLPIR